MKQQHTVIAGAGIMGASLSQVYAQAGWRVTLWNRSASGLERAKNLIALNQESLIKSELLTPEKSAALLENIAYTTDQEVMRDCDLILENIVEQMDEKQTFWEWASRLAPDDPPCQQYQRAFDYGNGKDGLPPGTVHGTALAESAPPPAAVRNHPRRKNRGRIRRPDV